MTEPDDRYNWAPLLADLAERKQRALEMGGAERVVDEDVAALGELCRVAGVVLRLPRVESGVLENGDAVVTDKLGEPGPNGIHGVRRPILICLRPAEMRAHPDLGGARVDEVAERRERRADTRVVCDGPVLERNVEIGTDENDLACDLGVANGTRESH